MILYWLVILIHVIVSLVLIAVILLQAGRGGGLVESFTSVESIFGTKTNAFLTRTTTILSSLFFITCLSLAILSARQNKSLLINVHPQGKSTQERAATGSAPVSAKTAEVPSKQGVNQAQEPVAPKAADAPQAAK